MEISTDFSKRGRILIFLADTMLTTIRSVLNPFCTHQASAYHKMCTNPPLATNQHGTETLEEDEDQATNESGCQW